MCTPTESYCCPIESHNMAHIYTSVHAKLMSQYHVVEISNCRDKKWMDRQG